MRVLDLGALADSWLGAPILPREIVMLNLPDWTTRAAASEQRLGAATTVRHVVGDACAPPAELLHERFDLVYCNSVIEHVGGHDRRIGLVNAIHRLGDHHWIQTPYRYFPIEPHALMPAMQFMPMSVRAAALRRWPLGHMSRYSPDWPDTELGGALERPAYGTPLLAMDPRYAALAAQSLELLSKTEMRAYFPTSEIIEERVCGIPKSLVAVR